MLARLRAPLLFFWLGTPIACYMPLVFSPPKEPPTGAFIFLIGPFLVLGMYVVGFVFSFGAGLLFSSIGDLYQRYTGRGVSMLLGGVLGAFSGAIFSCLAFGAAGLGLVNAVDAALAGGIAGLVCGLLYTHQCDGRFVPIWGDAAFRNDENAVAAAQLSKFLRLKSDGTLDGPHGHCPSCNAFIAQDSTGCPRCKVHLGGPDAFNLPPQPKTLRQQTVCGHD